MNPTASQRTGDALILRVEAMLFAAGKPLTVHELCTALGTQDFREVQRVIKHLQRNYSSRVTALEVRRAGEGWAVQVRPEYLPVAHQVASADIPQRTLRTLALVAYHQPVRQSLLVKMLGDSAYEEVQRLRELGFIRASPRGATLELTTTSKFPEYFGLEAGDRKRIKELLEKKLGVPASSLERGDTPEEEPSGSPGNPSDTASSAPASDGKVSEGALPSSS